MNAVRFRAGEIDQGGSVTIFRHDAEVHLKTVAQDDACPCLTRAKRPRNVREGKELAHHAFWRRSDDEQVKVSDGLAPAAIAPGDLDAFDLLAPAHMSGQAVRDKRGFVKREAPAC